MVLNMNSPTLYVYDPSDDENILLKVSYVEDGSSYYVRDEVINLNDNITLKVSSAYSFQNNGYSIAIKSNEKHQLTVMGFKKSSEQSDFSDPCIMWVAENGQMLQIAITI